MEILDWAEGNAEKLVQKYLDAEPNEVFSQNELKNKGDYYIGTESSGDGETVFVDICFGDEFEKHDNNLEKNYEYFTRYAEDISDNMNYDVTVMTNSDDQTIMFQFTDWFPEENEEPEEYAKGGKLEKAYEVILQLPNGKMNKRAVLLAKTKDGASKKALNLKEFKQYGYVVISANEIKYAKGGQVLDLKDVYNELRSKVGRLEINEESKDYIYCDIRDWGNWEHDYEDYERDEEDFEDDDSMILSESSGKKMQSIVEEIRTKYPTASIKWNTTEKNYIDFKISRKMADGGKINNWFEKPYNLREISNRSPFLIELNNSDCAKNIKNKNSQVEIIKLLNNRVSQPISYVLVIKNWTSVDELKNIFTECSSHIISYGFTSNQQIDAYRKMGSKMAEGGELEDDTFVMLFKGYGFVEKRGSYGSKTFYNKEHNAYIYYDPKYKSLSGYVGGGEGNDEVIPYSVEGVLDFFIEHDISESEATPLAKGGLLVQVGDKIKTKSGIQGVVYESTGQIFKLMDSLGVKSNTMHFAKDFKKGDIKTFGSGGMTAGRWYPDKTGEEFRYIGEDGTGKSLFNDGQKVVSKPLEDFEPTPREKKLFKFFRMGGGLKEDFLEDVAEMHDEIKEITLKDGSKITHDELMEAHQFLEPDETQEYYASMQYGKGGTFDSKVQSISKKLVGKPVPKQYRKEYGSRYDKDDAQEAARRIVGNMRKLYGE